MKNKFQKLYMIIYLTSFYLVILNKIFGLQCEKSLNTVLIATGILSNIKALYLIKKYKI